jgi:hypothetical protein
MKMPMPAPRGVDVLWTLRAFGISTNPMRGAYLISSLIRKKEAENAMRKEKNIFLFTFFATIPKGTFEKNQNEENNVIFYSFS